ncbi:MAG: cytochrome c3 family protein [Candidatus Methanoperedens sp.]|nr:cytochrome c3 family protein [Candidatus Methanoperedens sp.]
MALFAGQHSFYNIDSTGNQVPCLKCHGDVKAELQSNQITNVADKPDSNGPHYNFKCEYCHRAEPGYASGDNAYATIVYNNGSSYRYLAVTVYDFEAENYPKVINGSDVFPSSRNGGITTYGTTLAGSTLKSNGALSATVADPTLTVYAERLNPAFSRATGDPLDINASTRYGGLDLSQVLAFKGSGRSATADLNNSGSKAVNPGTNYHAASLVSCMECHRGSEPYGHYTRLAENGSNECGNCHYGGTPIAPGARWTDLAAGGFGLTDDAADTGAAEAHDEFTKASNTNGILRYAYNTSNAACVGCHTHVAVDINFTKRYKLSFDATGLDTGSWNMGNYRAEGTVMVSVFGNQSGETWATGNHSYTWPAGSEAIPDMYVNGNGTKITGLNNSASDSAAALTTP